MAKKPKFYRLDAILGYNAHYNVIIGERSNGKTFAVLEYALKQYCENGGQLAIVRRWNEDLRGKTAAQVFDNLVEQGLIEKYTGGQWSFVHYFSGRWYLAREDENGDRITDSTPFAFRFAITSVEHDKSSAYPNIRTVLFDEFIASGSYLPDEFVKFMNVLSTIIRHRNDVKIFMVGNTISKFCPYFAEMGLSNIKRMKPGTIDIYTYGDSDLRVAVEFSDFPAKRKDSDVYFGFNNPKLGMITGSGSIWQLEIYPHSPTKWKPKDVVFQYFVKFDDETLQCEVIDTGDGNPFIFVHTKTTPIKNPEYDLVYTTEFDVRQNWRRNILKPVYPIEEKILKLHRMEKVFYQSNEVGEIYTQYLKFCKG